MGGRHAAWAAIAAIAAWTGCTGGAAPALPPSLPATPPPPTAPAHPPASVELGALTLVATGDLLIHEAVQRAAAAKGYPALFADTTAPIAAADVAFANLETPVAPTTGKPIAPLEFNAPPALLEGLVAAGFDVVSFANNHVYDQGRAGLAETMDHLDEAHLQWVGAGRTCAEAAAPRTFTAGGLTLALIGTSQLYNDRLNAGADEPCADTFDLARVLAATTAAKAAGADVVAVSIHWGVEYASAPTQAQVDTAHALIEGGVDLVLGHHPHVLEPIEVVHAADGRVGVIAYSLGNYVSNQSAWYEPGLNPASTANPRDGVLLSIRAVRRAYGLGEHKVERVELADLRVTPLWTANDGTTRGAGTPVIRVEQLPARIVELRARLASASDADLPALGAELDEAERRWRQVQKVVGEQFLVEHP